MKLTSKLLLAMASNGAALPYAQKVDNAGAYAYWAFDELVGTNAAEYDTAGLDGTYSGVTLDSIDGPAAIGGRAGLFDGVDDHVNLYTTTLRSGYNGGAGGFGIWVRPSAAGIWSATTRRDFARFRAGSSNEISLYHPNIANRVVARYRAGGTLIDVPYTFPSEPLDWVYLYMSWQDAANGDAVRLFADGVQVGSTGTGAGTWAGGNLDSSYTVVGREQTTSGTSWSGYLAGAHLFTTVPSDATILSLAS